MAHKTLTGIIDEVKTSLRATGVSTSVYVEAEITDGAITRSARYMSLTVEDGSGAGADTLKTINSGGCADGTRLTLKLTYGTSDDYVTHEHGSGNLELMEIADVGRDFTQNSLTDRIEYERDSTNEVWVECWRHSGEAI